MLSVNMEILSFVFSLFSHVMDPSMPVEMSAEAAAVACSENSEGWESSSSADNSSLLFVSSFCLSSAWPQSRYNNRSMWPSRLPKAPAFSLKKWEGMPQGIGKYCDHVEGEAWEDNTIKLFMNFWTHLWPVHTYYHSSPRLLIGWYKVGQIQIAHQRLWKLSWYWNHGHNSHFRTCGVSLTMSISC